MNQPGTLFFFCGKIAAGKSTLARTIAQREHTVLLVQDDLLTQLFPNEITDVPTYVQYSSRLNTALTTHICSLLVIGVSVVLDFPGNTRKQRAWFRSLFEQAIAPHELHYIEASDELCKQQLRQRSQDLPQGSAFTSDAEFDAVTQFFQAPATDENFTVIHHQRS
jgi:predicted kinase